MMRTRRLILSRFSERGSDGGVALLTAILFMVIMAGISTVILGVVTTQVFPSYLAQKGTKTVYSAQAGIQAALAVMRSATTLDTTLTPYGDTTKLPCLLSGTSNATADGNAYSVTITYYASDPTSQTPAWRATAANQIQCNTGTYGSPGNGPTSTPKFALISSAGVATQVPISVSTGNRTIAAVYQFKTAVVNVPGGLINNAGGTACVAATSAVVGSKIGFVATASCVATPSLTSLQLWSYTKTWQLALASTQVGGAVGLCISGSVATTPSGTTSTPVTLQVCGTSADPTRWNQLWSWTGSYTWEGEVQAISGPNGSAWLTSGVSDGSSPIGSFLQVATTPKGTLAPTSTVGAGGANYSTHQLVNYQEFGNCADITNEDITHQFQISFPCKQDPTGGTTAITWNQKWYYCEAGDIGHTTACSGRLPDGTAISVTNQQIYVYYKDVTAQKYCLTSPLLPTVSPAPAGSFYPYFTACAASGALQKQQVWARTYTTSSPATNYNITDYLNRCLEANSLDQFATSPAISKLWVATCNGYNYQKWNAIPTYDGGTVASYREISGG